MNTVTTKNVRLPTDRTVYGLPIYDTVAAYSTAVPAVLAMDLRVGDVLPDGRPSVSGWMDGVTNYINGYQVAPWMLIPLRSLAPVTEPEPKLPRIPDASKLEPGSVLENSVCQWVIDKRHKYGRGWHFTRDGLAAGWEFDAEIEATYRLVSLAPPRPKVGDVVERVDAERLHIYELVILDDDGDVAIWDSDKWRVAGDSYCQNDRYLRFPVRVLHVPEVTT